MISISKFQNKDQASSYYEKENYYQKNSEKGYFHGAATTVIGLKEGQVVTEQVFKSLLNNKSPLTGEYLTKNTKNPRAGFDVTFSAPKSVSILMESYEANKLNDEALKLREAHEKAVQAAMKEIEKYALTRIRNEAGEIERIKANIVYASFQHDTTRMTPAGEIDPQLHTHNFIFNVVSYIDPKDEKLKTGAIENFEIYKNKMYFGQLYRNELANNLKELGYKIEITDTKNGFFEIKGFSKEQLEEFSGRSLSMRELIDKYKEKYPNAANEAKLLEIINQDIKPAKGKIDRDEVREKNKIRLEKVGLTIDKIKNFLLSREKEPVNKSIRAEEILKLSAKAITENNSTFTKEELFKNALKLGLKEGITKEQLEVAIKFTDNIIQLDKNVFTTMEILKAEKYIISKITDKTEQLINDNKKINEFIESKYKNMTFGQKEMFAKILTTNNQFLVVQGDAGTGKTYSMKAIREFLEKEQPNREIIGLSFTGKAAAGLEEDSGIKSTTIHSFLNKEAKEPTGDKNRLIIVDEAGLAGSQQIAEIINIAKQNNDKVVFVGDIKQFKAIAAGDIFAEMQKYGAETVNLGETLRQKTELTKEAVNLTKQRDFDTLFSLLSSKNKVVEDNKEELYQKITKDFFDKKGDLLIIASKNEDRKRINELIREKKDNSNSVKIKINEILSFTGVDKYFSNNYINTTLLVSKIEGFKNGEVLKVIDKKDDFTLIVKTAKDEIKELDLKKYADDITAFKIVEKDFVKGEKIVFTKNSKEFKNGEIDYIKDIKKDGTITLQSGKSFNFNKYNYFDYGYAITDYKAQGVTAKDVAILADSKMATFNSFYTQLTRAKEDVKIYTNNIEELRANIEREAYKTSTLKYQERREYDNSGTFKGDIEKSRGNKRGSKEYKREYRELREERLRFKKFIHRTIERLKSVIHSFSKDSRKRELTVTETTKDRLLNSLNQKDNRLER